MIKNNGIVALNSTEATITTATITIKALKVNNRQLTQAVFRQLPERKLIDESKPELIGLPWGWVNYQAGDMAPGRQFVVQFGTSLARCPVRMGRASDTWAGNFNILYDHHINIPKPYKELQSRYISLAKDNILFSAIGGTLATGCAKNLAVGFRAYGGFPYLYMNIRNHFDKVVIENIQRAIAPQQHHYSYDESKRENVMENARIALRELMAGRYDDDADDIDCWDEMKRLADQAAAYCRRWDDLIGTLECVEQLFIAT